MLFENYLNIFHNILAFTVMRKTFQNFAIFLFLNFFYGCHKATCDGGHWNKIVLIDKQELSI